MESRRIPRPGRLAAIPVAIISVFILTLTGCGSKSSDNNSPASSPTASPTSTATAGNTATLCRDVDALRSSITDLRNVPLNADALSTLSTKTDLISSRLAQLRADAPASLRPQIDKVSAALLVLKSNLGNAVASPSTRHLSVIPPAAVSVATAANNLRAALPDC